METFNPGYYNKNELIQIGFKSVGENVLVAKNCTIIGIENIQIASNVRIDGFTTIVANGDGYLTIGSYVHIGGYSYLSAGAGIELKDFSGLSQGVKIYTKSDDYSGEYLTNPTVPAHFTNVNSGSVVLNKHVIIGSSSIILPNVTLGEGVSVGANSLVNKNLSPWTIYTGSPVKKLKPRSKALLDLEKQLIQATNT